MTAKMDTGVLNYQWSLTIIDSCISSGVSHAVISPGSRSTPLTLACERHPGIKTWVQVDERSAAFFALGLAYRNKHPVVLICTSGSALANWFPAVVEASQSQIPLILLSADRPAELQNCGANQTINQQQLFGSFVNAFYAVPEPDKQLFSSRYLPNLLAKATAKTVQLKAGPVHLNIPFREPLLPTIGNLDAVVDQLTKQILSSLSTRKSCLTDILGSAILDQADVNKLSDVIVNGDGLIVVGRKHYADGFAQQLHDLAKKLNVAVFVDQLSGLRFGLDDHSHFIANYDHFLRCEDIDDRLACKPDWVLRFGQFPVSKALANYLSQCHDTVSFVVNDSLTLEDPLLSADYMVCSDDVSICQALFQQVTHRSGNHLFSRISYLEKQATADIQAAVNEADGFSDGQLIFSLLDKILPDSFIFSGNSTIVRHLDTYTLLTRHSQKNVSIYCNRGASGIDGNVSTYLGLLAEQTDISGVALLGDLTFFHDMNGLALCAELNANTYNGTIIVINNNGGCIFNYLPQHQLREFEKYWLTPQKLDFSASAKVYGLGFQRVDSTRSFELALEKSFDTLGVDIIEVLLNS